MSRPTCKYFLQGNCRYGANCKFFHPGSRQPQNSNPFQNSNPNQNRFGVFQSNQPDRYRPGQNVNRGQGPDKAPFHLDPKIIEQDLTGDRPIWFLSSYGPGRDAPRELFGGYPMEQSFEELRVKYYLAQANGNVQAAIQEEQQLLSSAEGQIQNVLKDLNGAVKYVIDGQNQHPNRWDILKSSETPGIPPPPVSRARSQFQAPPPGPSGPSGFGQPSALGAAQAKPPFGAPSFGQPSAAQSTFGQPSAPSSFGRPAAFGQPSVPGQQSAFGQPSMPTQQSPFGQPSALGQQSAFGKPSIPGQNSPFGQPSAVAQQSPFGQSPAPSNQSPFAQAATPSQPSAFGQAGNLGQNTSPFASKSPAFGQSGFGQPSALGQPSAFGKPAAAGPQGSLFGQAASSAFGQPSAPGNNASPFSQPAPAQPANPFSQTSQTNSGPFGGSGASNGAFGQASAPQTASPFGQPAAQTNSPFGQANGQPVTSSPLGAGPQTNGFGSAGAPTPSSSGAATTKDASGRLTSYKGRPVRYVDEQPHYQSARNELVRIFFPDGPPARNPYAEAPPELYTPAHEEAYNYAREHGEFKDGIMPELPPLVAWNDFDL